MNKAPSSSLAQKKLAWDSIGHSKAGRHRQCFSRTDHLGPSTMDRPVQYPFWAWGRRSSAQHGPAISQNHSHNSDTLHPSSSRHLLVDGWVDVCKWRQWSWLCHLCSGYSVGDQGQSCRSRNIWVQGWGYGLFLLVYRQSSSYMIIKLARVLVLTHSKSLLQRLTQGPARQADTLCSSIWTVLATIGLLNLVNIQLIPGHMGLEGNTEADLEAKRSTSLPPVSYTHLTLPTKRIV